MECSTNQKLISIDSTPPKEIFRTDLLMEITLSHVKPYQKLIFSITTRLDSPTLKYKSTICSKTTTICTKIRSIYQVNENRKIKNVLITTPVDYTRHT